jgi:heme oxygenase
MATGLTRQRRPLRELLREAAASPHARLDTSFTAHVGTVSGYVFLLQTLESFHCSADPLLAAWVAGSTAAPAVSIPERTPGLQSDLVHLGVGPRSPLDLSDLPHDRATGLLTDGAGLALLYVAAGSSIGARVVLRQLDDGIPANARTGLAQGASPASAGLWRTTLGVLGAVACPPVEADATRTCRLVFEALCARSDSALHASTP